MVHLGFYLNFYLKCYRIQAFAHSRLPFRLWIALYTKPRFHPSLSQSPNQLLALTWVFLLRSKKKKKKKCWVLSYTEVASCRYRGEGGAPTQNTAAKVLPKAGVLGRRQKKSTGEATASGPRVSQELWPLHGFLGSVIWLLKILP